MVHKRLEKGAGGKGQHKDDFVAHMLRNGDDPNNKGMSLPELETNVANLLLAGMETTSTALTGITNFLLQNPNELTKLVAEIRTAFSNENDITQSAVQNLPYLGAVIEEGLRLAPPVPEGLSRVIPPEGHHIAGHWIPGGVCHLLSPYTSINAHDARNQAPITTKLLRAPHLTEG